VKHVNVENAAARPARDAVGWTLTLAAALGLVGLALQSVLGFGPWRDMFWREAWISPLVNMLGLSWGEYLRHPMTNPMLRGVEVTLGAMYALAAVLCLTARPRWLATVALVAAVGLISLDAWFSYIGHGHRVFQLFEYALRWFAPLAVVGILFGMQRSRAIQWALRVTIALTFAGHGLWAMGVSFSFGPIALHYPTPGLWVDMVLQVLPMLDEGSARDLLRVAGVLDWAVAVGLFLPWRFAWPAVGWAIVWGGLTTAARLVANADALAVNEAAVFWFSEAVRRVPHFALPVALWLLLSHSSDGSTVASSAGAAAQSDCKRAERGPAHA
jgi:hypothetical protein